MRGLLLFLAVMAAAFPAWADSAPEIVAVYPGIGRVVTMCNATGSTGICSDADGDEIVFDTTAFNAIVVDLSQSTASSIDCDAVGNNAGYDVENTGTVLNSTALSTTQYAITLTDTPRYVWITCSTVSGGNVTATIFARDNR